MCPVCRDPVCCLVIDGAPFTAGAVPVYSTVLTLRVCCLSWHCAGVQVGVFVVHHLSFGSGRRWVLVLLLDIRRGCWQGAGARVGILCRYCAGVGSFLAMLHSLLAMFVASPWLVAGYVRYALVLACSRVGVGVFIVLAPWQHVRRCSHLLYWPALVLLSLYMLVSLFVRVLVSSCACHVYPSGAVS